MKTYLRSAATVLLLFLWVSIIQANEFAGNNAPIIVDVQGRAQRKNILFGYTNNFRIPGSEPFLRLQRGLCTSSRFRLGLPRFLRGTLVRCDLVTVSWDKPVVTLRLSFNRTSLTQQGLSGGSKSFQTLLRVNLERYRVCDRLDAFTGRLYFANARELIANAVFEVRVLTRTPDPVNHTVLANEVIRRYPPMFGLKAAFRNVFLVDANEMNGNTAFIYKFYFSEYVLSKRGVDVYTEDFRVISDTLLKGGGLVRNETLYVDGTIFSIERAYEDSLDMAALLKKSTEIPFRVDLNYIPKNVFCELKME